MPKRKLQKIPIYDPENDDWPEIELPDSEEPSEKTTPSSKAVKEFDPTSDELPTNSVPMKLQAQFWLNRAKNFGQWPNYAQLDKFQDCCRKGKLTLESFGVTQHELNILRLDSYKFAAGRGGLDAIHIYIFNEWRKHNKIDLEDLGVTEADIKTIFQVPPKKINTPKPEETQDTIASNKPDSTIVKKKNSYEIAAVRAYNASVILTIAGEIRRRKGYVSRQNIQREILSEFLTRYHFGPPCKPDEKSQKNAARRAIAVALKFQ